MSNKPLGYFCDQNSELIADAEESWGSHFEALNDAQKFWVLHQIGLHLFMKDPEHAADSEHDGEVEYLTENLAQISRGDLLGLVQFLGSNLK
ncbi:MAG: hypothetical protein KME22_06625 [Hassallia sp. WJT32-NPBG1]|jgi:hypothetical protein|nr:hypothetical protein [Hassallia sp. WJT32-NPBG1]